MKIPNYIKKSIIVTPVIVLFALLVSLYFGIVDFTFSNNNYEQSYEKSYISITNTTYGTGYVSITNTTAQKFKEYYIHNDTEFSACLNIEKKDNYYNDKKELNVTYIIDSIDGDVKYGGINYVGNIRCKDARIHSHPSGTCKFSIGDIRVFKKNIERGMYLTVVMCGEDKFIFITRNYFKERWAKII